MRGELRLKGTLPDLAEVDFQEAIALAKKMSARTLELGATMSLARILARHSKRDEALAMLANHYGWFYKGFDTADLKEAKALADEFAG
jgi:hypothetical protein